MAENKVPMEFTLSIKNSQNLETVSKNVNELLKKIIDEFFKTEEKPFTVEEIDKLIKEAKDRLKGEQDKKITEIEKFYKEKRDVLTKAENNAKTPEERLSHTNARLRLALLEANEKEQIQNESDRKILEAEAKLVDRKIALSNKFYLFKSDKDRISLEEQKKNAEEQLRSLKESQSINNTPDLAIKVEEAELKVKELDKSIEKLSVQKIGEMVTLLGGTFKGLGSTFSNNTTVSKLSEWGSGFAESATNMLSGNPAKMIDGAFKAIGTVKDIFSTNNKANKEIAEFNRQLEVTAVKYSISVINAIKDIKGVGDSIFNKDINNNLERGMEGYEKAIDKTKELTSQLDKVDIEVDRKKKKFLGITTGTKKEMDDVLSGYKKVLGTEEELVNKETGRIDKNMAQALLNSGKLSKEATDLITNIVAAQDAADAAMKQIEETLTGIVGTLGTDLRTALVDAFKSGSTEAEAFKKSVSKIMEDIVTQNLFSAIFGEMLKEMETRMKDSYKEGGDKDITDDIAWFYANYSAKVNDFNEGLKGIKEQMSENGLDILSTESPPPTTGQGLASITQDSANQLNGSFDNMLRYTSAIHDNTEQSLLVQRTMQSQLNRIADNTEYCRYLENVKNSLEEMQTKGVKLKV